MDRSCTAVHAEILPQSWQDIANILWKSYSKILAESCQVLIKIMPRSCSEQEFAKIMDNVAKILARFIQTIMMGNPGESYKILPRFWTWDSMAIKEVQSLRKYQNQTGSVYIA